MTPTQLRSLVAIVLLTCVSQTAHAQNDCRILCAPEFKVEPTVTIENLWARPRVATVENGETVEVQRLEREAVFEMVLAMSIATAWPRLGVTVESIWTPFSETSTDPLTGKTAGDLGESIIRDNPLELEIELNVSILTPERTRGWLDMHFDIVDKFSPAERPHAGAAYTHKLNFELDTAVHVLKWLAGPRWLGQIELEGSLDYVATGLLRRGDMIGNERFLENASPWSFSVLFVLPIAPFFQ